MALALKNGKIPPSLNFQRPNPKIDFAGSPFFVATRCLDWPTDGPRLAAVNSLGLGGTNAFAVLAQAPAPAGANAADEPPVSLFTLSAKTPAALRASIERHHAWVDGRAEADLPAICSTLSSGRNHFAHRFATLASSIAQLRAALAEELQSGGREVAKDEPAASGKRRLAFLFSGQGSQHAGMAAELYRLPAGLPRGRRPLRRAVARAAGTAVAGGAFSPRPTAAMRSTKPPTRNLPCSSCRRP